MNEQKQQQKLSAEARKVLAGFTALTDAEKIQVLNRARVWYLKHKGALVAPMLEMREILQGLARLSWIVKRIFMLGENRKIALDMQLLKAISENTIRQDVVVPVTGTINSYISKLEELIINAKKKMEENNA